MAAADPANPYGAALPWPTRKVADEDATHRPGRKAGALVALVDGELVWFLERGGRSLLSFTDDAEAHVAAATALADLVSAGRVPSFLIEKVNGVPVLEPGAEGERAAVQDALIGAGFTRTPTRPAAAVTVDAYSADMPLRTALTAMLGIAHPIVLAPMGGVAGGALAAAVSEGGGLGLIGAGRGDPELARSRMRARPRRRRRSRGASGSRQLGASMRTIVDAAIAAVTGRDHAVVRRSRVRSPTRSCRRHSRSWSR